MNITKRLVAVVALAISIMASATPVPAEILISVEDIRGVVATKSQWASLGEYLSAQMGEPVSFVPLVSEKAMEAAARKEVAFMLGNPAITASVYAAHNTTLVATLIQPWGTDFAGLIFTRPDTGIRTIEDLRGKRLISHTFSSGGGHLYQRYHLLAKGFDIFKEFKEIKTVPRQDDIVLSVKAGLFDVGFCRTGIIDDLVKKGKAKWEDFVVIDKADDPSYPFVHTTTRYPEWYMVALAGTDPTTTARLKAALLALPPESPTAVAANIKGFREPLPIDPMIDLLKALKIEPFNQ